MGVEILSVCGGSNCCRESGVRYENGHGVFYGGSNFSRESGVWLAWGWGVHMELVTVLGEWSEVGVE